MSSTSLDDSAEPQAVSRTAAVAGAATTAGTAMIRDAATAAIPLETRTRRFHHPEVRTADYDTARSRSPSNGRAGGPVNAGIRMSNRLAGWTSPGQATAAAAGTAAALCRPAQHS
ncbi:hypothetical protein NN3_15120 [Nocardia neocaledoniensis NBRC 108232]|nr:hypothetical protein NN3_15120 [Nocardia neocaledoniensis NBRC 108232]